MNILKTSSLCVVSALAASTAPALAGPLDRIVGDALRIDVQAGGRTAFVAIPKGSLIEGLSTELWSWSSISAIPFIANDGTTLGSFTGRIGYETDVDKVVAALVFDAGVDTMQIRFSTGTLENAAIGADRLLVKSSLIDLNFSGAGVAPILPGTRIFGGRRDGTDQVQAIEGYAASSGSSEVRNDVQQSDSDALAGGKRLVGGFSLSPGDEFQFEVESITSVPAPAGAFVLVGGLALASRRRR